MTEDLRTEIENLENNRKLIDGVYVEVSAKVNNVTWDMNVTFTDGEIKAMLIDALDKKILALGKEINDFVFEQDVSNSYIDGQIITDEAMEDVEWSIRDRAAFVEELKYTWIPEAKASGDRDYDVSLMEGDLEYLEKYEDEYILSSQRTNAYLIQSEVSDQKELKEVCNRLIELSKTQLEEAE